MKIGPGQKQGNRPGAAQHPALGEHRVALAAGAHDPGHQVEALQARFVHHQEPVSPGHQIDLAFPGRFAKGDSFSSHGLGEGQGGVIFVHPLGADLIFLHHIEVPPAHLLQAAEVPHADELAFLKGRAFTGPRDDHGHIVQGPAAHRLLHRQQLQRRGLPTLASSS